MTDTSRRSKRRVICATVAVICALVVAWCVFTVVTEIREYDRSLREYESLRDSLLREDAADTSAENAGVRIDYSGGVEYLKESYPNTYGYIVIDGTDVNYPVMRAKDNNFYLYRSYTGAYSPIGSVFADYRCKDDPEENANTVLYAHNLMYGGMFHAIEEMCRDKELFENAVIRFYTQDAEYVYKPVSVYETVSDGDYFKTEFADDEELSIFMKDITERSVHEVPELSDGGLLTLSTCTNRQQSGRFALHAILVGKELCNE